MLTSPCDLPDDWRLQSLVFSAEIQSNVIQKTLNRLGVLRGSFAATFADATGSCARTCNVDATWSAHGCTRDVFRTTLGVVIKVHTTSINNGVANTLNEDEALSHLTVPYLSNFTPRVYGEVKCVINRVQVSALMIEEVALNVEQYMKELFSSDLLQETRIRTFVALQTNWYSLVHRMVMNHNIELKNVHLSKWGVVPSKQSGPECLLLSWGAVGQSMRVVNRRATNVSNAVRYWLRADVAPNAVASMEVYTYWRAMLQCLREVAWCHCPLRTNGKARFIEQVPAPEVWEEMVRELFFKTEETFVSMLSGNTKKIAVRGITTFNDVMEEAIDLVNSENPMLDSLYDLPDGGRLHSLVFSAEIQSNETQKTLNKLGVLSWDGMDAPQPRDRLWKWPWTWDGSRGFTILVRNES